MKYLATEWAGEFLLENEIKTDGWEVIAYRPRHCNWFLLDKRDWFLKRDYPNVDTAQVLTPSEVFKILQPRYVFVVERIGYFTAHGSLTPIRFHDAPDQVAVCLHEHEALKAIHPNPRWIRAAEYGDWTNEETGRENIFKITQVELEVKNAK